MLCYPACHAQGRRRLDSALRFGHRGRGRCGAIFVHCRRVAHPVTERPFPPPWRAQFLRVVAHVTADEMAVLQGVICTSIVVCVGGECLTGENHCNREGDTSYKRFHGRSPNTS